jgi:hypothetical protein
MSNIIKIEDEGTLIAMVISNSIQPEETEFYTGANAVLQIGHIIINPEKPIKRHFHNPIERQIIGTTEVLILKKGRVQVSLFNKSLVEIENIILESGDLIYLIAGGHAFKALEPSIFIEVKNGPFAKSYDKVYF